MDSRTLLTALLAGILAGCATPASTYRASSLRISAVPNTHSQKLEEIRAPKVEEVLNRAFMSDGRFQAGTDLFLSIEVTRLDLPRSTGTREFTDRYGPGYTFLPGIIVVTARWFDAKQQKLEEAEFAQDIIPAAGELNSYAAVNRAIDDVTRRIMDYTMKKYYAPGQPTR